MKVTPLRTRILFWLSLVFSAQLFAWTASSVAMSWLDHGLVTGEANAAADIPGELAARSYANPGGVIARTPGASALRLAQFLDHPVYEARGVEGAALFDAQTGQKISPINEDQARKIAKRDFVGEGEIDSMRYLTAPPREYGREGPVWRATFTDDLKTRLYISPETGAIEARKNKISRLYDFFTTTRAWAFAGLIETDNLFLRMAGFAWLALGFGALGAVIFRYRRNVDDTHGRVDN